MQLKWNALRNQLASLAWLSLDAHRFIIIICTMEENAELPSPILSIEKPRVIWRQVADQMRNQILSGELPPNTKLPSTAQIAKNSRTDVKTVHKALSVLVKEGLLSRQRKVGTYVRERRKSLSPMGIYTTVNNMITPSRQFTQFLNYQVQQAAHQRGIETHLWYDRRPDSKQTTLLPEIQQALHAGKINSLIILSGSASHRSWIDGIPVPISLMGENYPFGVSFDYRDFLAKAIKALSKKGCKSVSLLSNLPPEFVDDPFADLCGQYGLAWRPRHVVHYENESNHSLDRFGYDGFRRLWSSEPYPDGIILFPDATISGLLLAALKAGVNIGEDLKLAVHRNKGMEFLCPVPASFVVSDVQACAEALIDQAQAMMEGVDPQLKLLPYSIEESKQ